MLLIGNKPRNFYINPILSSDRKGVSVPPAGCSHAAPQFWAGLTSTWTMGMYYLSTAQHRKAHNMGKQQLLWAGSNPPAWTGSLSTY